MRRVVLFFLCCSFASALLASTLNTPSFTVTIASHCEEGNVTCDNVSYLGVSKKTGNSVSLKGKTIHTRCKDGSPCRFLGYEFRSGRTFYRVLEEGRLEVSQGNKVLVDEKGDWDW
jgi:hypothetical protein